MGTGPFKVFLFLARLSIDESLSFIRVERLQIEELFWEVLHAVKSNQVGHTLAAFPCEAELTGFQTAVLLHTRFCFSDTE